MNENQPDTPIEIAPYPADWSLFARRVAAVALLLTVLFIASLVGPVVQNTVFALILAFILFYPIRVLNHRTPLGYKTAAVLVFVLYLVLAYFIVLNVATPVANFLSGVFTAFEVVLSGFIIFLRNYTPDQGWLLDEQTGARIINLNFILEPLSVLARGQWLERLMEVIPNLLGALTATAGTLGSLLGNVFLIHVLALVFILEIPAGFKWLFEIITPIHRREYAILFERMSKIWTAYFRATLTVGLLMGLLVFVQLTVMGIRNAAIIAIVVGIFALLPVIGGFIAFPAVGLNALLAGSTTLTLSPFVLTLITLVIYQIIATLVSQFIFPKLAGDAISLPLSLVILGIIIGGALGGMLGIFLAPPVMGVIRQVVEFVLKKIRGGDPYPGEPEPAYLAHGLFSPAQPKLRPSNDTESEMTL